MENLWNAHDSEQHESASEQCLYAGQLLARESTLVGDSSVSVKIKAKDIFGDEQDILHFRLVAQTPDSPLDTRLTEVRLNPLVRLAGLEYLPDQRLAKELERSVTEFSFPAPPVDVMVHALVPDKYVMYTRPESVLSIMNTPQGDERVREAYGASILVVPYARSGLPLANRLAKALSPVPSGVSGLVLMRQGLVSFGDTAHQAYTRMRDLITKAEEYLRSHAAWRTFTPEVDVRDNSVRQALASVRKAISQGAGAPMILSTDSSQRSLRFASRPDVATVSQLGPAVPDHAVYTRRTPMVGRDVHQYSEGYAQYVADHVAEVLNERTLADTAPRVVLDPELGLCAAAPSARDARAVRELYRHTIEVILRSMALDAYSPLPARDIWETEFHGIELAKAAPTHLPVFAGEVAMVTGAASGIGKACVEALRKRGAAVVGLDINAAIEQTDSDNLIGIRCDITDEGAISQALERTVRSLGGLDMLVLNAGVFPASCPIRSLQLADWHRVMSINLDANLVLLRESHSLLKLAPRGGRVVINGSRNVLAPGPGAAAYSASKAALVQLARVAALEWGKDGIRLNIVHPNAVFDTGLYTDEILRSRAQSYGMTVEQYKKNNVLGAEITSHDVGELVAEMCGPLFAKSTGVQVSIDGGSDRVI